MVTVSRGARAHGPPPSAVQYCALETLERFLRHHVLTNSNDDGIIPHPYIDESTVRIERLHLEHDSGKSIHTLSSRFSAVDLNRAGTGLMEMVRKRRNSLFLETASFLHSEHCRFRSASPGVLD